MGVNVKNMVGFVVFATKLLGKAKDEQIEKLQKENERLKDIAENKDKK